MRTQYRLQIERAAREHGLDPDLVEAVVLQESSGFADAFRYEPSVWNWFRSHPTARGLIARRAASSYGLMQILYATATDYGFVAEPEYLFLPHVNLDLGCQHLAALVHWAHGDVSKALAAYNGGKGNADKAQTKAYAQAVLRKLKKVQEARGFAVD